VHRDGSIDSSDKMEHIRRAAESRGQYSRESGQLVRRISRNLEFELHSCAETNASIASLAVVACLVLYYRRASTSTGDVD